ncbi:MAG TPA: urease accessory UreF family protein [Acidimicrobiales bacterium]
MDPTSRSLLALMTLGDGRFPVGGHAHSGGVESAVADGRVIDVESLEAFVAGRLRTTGLVDAAVTAATVVRLEDPLEGLAADAVLRQLDREAQVRIPAPPLREASRRLGRQLVRVAARCWPASELALVADLFPTGAHQSVALGAVAVAARLGAEDAALLSFHHAATMPAQAAVRLLGLDPFEVAALSVRLGGLIEILVVEALTAAAGPLDELPAGTGPLLEIAAVQHRRLDPRLFVT